MIINCQDYNLSIELSEINMDIIVLERPEDYLNMLSGIYGQINGRNEFLILYEKEDYREILASKVTEIILSPLLISLNSKKIINSIYKEIVEDCLENYPAELQLLNAGAISFIETLIQNQPYNLDYDLGLDVNALLKLYGVHVSEEYDSVLEHVIDYLKLSSKACGTRVFFLAGFHDYFTKDDLEILCKDAMYQKISLVMIEPKQPKELNHSLRYHIIDKDHCLIEF